MSNASPRGSTWRWWPLLVLPASLLVGWGIGELPTGGSPSTASAARAGASVDRPGTDRAREGEYSQWSSLEEALAESRRNGKPVMIDFSAAWCGPCQALKRTVFENPERARVVQTAVIPVSIVDRVREDGDNPPEIEALQRRYEIDAFPTLVVFSPKSGKVQKARGFRGPDGTVAWITEAAKSMR